MGEKSSSKRGISNDQLRKIWSVIKHDDWLTILQQYRRDNAFVPAGQGIIKGKCIHPDHADTDPSAYMYLDKGYYKCFGCGYYERNPIVLMKHILGTTQVEALHHLTEKFKVKILSKKAQNELEAQQKNQRVKKEIYRVTHSMMCDAIADPTNSKNSYAKNALDYLANTRQIDINNLHALPVSIMPKLGVLTQRILAEYGAKKKQWDALPEFNRPPEPEDLSKEVFSYLKETVDTTYLGSLIFPMHTSPADIGRLKFRVPTSGHNKKIRFPADEFEDLLGLYGLGWEQYNVFTNQKSSMDYIYVTEGEFDVLSLMSRWVSAGRVPFPIVAAGGSGAKEHIEPILEGSGFTQAYLVGDSPSSQGNRIVGEWLSNFYKMDVKIFSGWGNLPNSGDLDEAVLRQGESAVEKELLTDFDKTFDTAWQWNYNNVSPVLDNINPADFRKMMETAASAGKLLKNKLEQVAYCDAIESQYNLKSALLRREISAHEDTEPGFTYKCADALSDLLYIVGNEPCEGKQVLVLYVKATKQLHKIRIDSDDFVEKLAPIIGTVIDFVDEYVGLPGFLQGFDDTEGLVMAKLDKDLRFYIRQAFLSLTHGSPEISNRQFRQGYHCITLPDGDKVEYIVCGPDIFHIKRDGDDCKFIPLEGPSDKGIVFNIHEGGQPVYPWLPGGMTVEKLEKAKNTNIKQVYDDLVEIFDCGYLFKHQKITCQLLAALMLLYPISTAFSRQVLLFITGDTSSGKSSLLSMFADTGYKGIQILRSSVGMENYTTASVASVANNSSQLLVLDEFESSDIKKGEHVAAIFEMFRPLVSGDATRKLGQPGGKGHSTQYFNLPVIFAAIQGADRPQDLNRLLVVEMKKNESKDNVVTTILNTFGEQKIEDLSQKVSTCMYPHAMKLAAYENEVRKEFKQLQSMLSDTVSYRLASSLFGAMAVMKMLGIDYKKFFVEYMTKHSDIVQRASNTNESDSYLMSILGNPVELAEDGHRSKTTIRKLLMDSENRYTISSAAWGTYFDEDRNYLVLLLDTVMNTLVPNHLKNRGMHGSRLKEVLGRHKMALTPEQILSSGILTKIAPTLGAGIREQDVVVLNAKSWLESSGGIVEDPTEPNPQESVSDVRNKTNKKENDLEETLEEKDASDFIWD